MCGRTLKGFEDEFHPYAKHDARGILSMANKGANENKSQFFITYAKQFHLNNQNSVFGKIIDGFDSLDSMERVPVDKKYRPTTEIKIKSVTIHANPLA
jgi:peptidyl-prolyl cis-trans isomerase-like 3